MKARFLRSVGAFALLSLLLIGCGRQAATPSPLPNPTAATGSANVRRWSSSPVVASLYYSPGFTPETYAWSAMSPLVVYADGRVIVVDYDFSTAQDTRSVTMAQIAPDELCSLLGAIDGYGFFDYNAAEYLTPDITDNGTTVIKVDAWRSMEARPYALGHALNPWTPPGMEKPEVMTVPSALSETHRLLADYRPANLAPYQPERIALLIQRNVGQSYGQIWPLVSPSLHDMVAALKENEAEVVLEGQQAADVYALFGELVTRTYHDGDDSYTITLRPLLPLETWEPQNGWGHESTFQSEPKVDLTCAQ